MNADDVRQEWAERSGEYSPAYYAYYGPDETSERVRESLERFVGRDAAVLELGCSSGRHLSHLHDAGFTDLSGVELNDEAFDVMAEAYPDLAAAGTFHAAAIEDVVGEFDDDRFDAVYSVETLQHIHPDDEWVFAELARITDELLVTAEIEEPTGDESTDEAGPTDGASTGDGTGTDADVNYVRDEFPLYYRDWTAVFTDLGFTEVDVDETKRDTVRTFRA